MFIKGPIEAKLELEILSALKELESHRQDPEKYAATLDRIVKLSKLKSEETRMKPPSMDTALIVAANVFGILWLARYERENVITTKALPFVMRPR